MQRSDQHESESSVDDLLAGLNLDEDDSTATKQGRKSGGRLSGLFSPKTFLLALVLSIGGVVVGGAIPLIGFFGQFLGIAAIGFTFGILGSKRRYAEIGLAGAVAAGFAFVLSTLLSVFAPFALQLLTEYGLAIAGVGSVTGALAGLAGHYFGRDMRDGLTREI